MNSKQRAAFLWVLSNVTIILLKIIVGLAINPIRVIAEAIRIVLKEHYSQCVEFHKLRNREAGPERHIDLHRVLAKNVDLQVAHAICTHLEDDIKTRFIHSQTIIHIEPCESGCPNFETKGPLEGPPNERSRAL